MSKTAAMTLSCLPTPSPPLSPPPALPLPAMSMSPSICDCDRKLWIAWHLSTAGRYCSLSLSLSLSFNKIWLLFSHSPLCMPPSQSTVAISSCPASAAIKYYVFIFSCAPTKTRWLIYCRRRRLYYAASAKKFMKRCSSFTSPLVWHSDDRVVGLCVDEVPNNNRDVSLLSPFHCCCSWLLLSPLLTPPLNSCCCFHRRSCRRHLLLVVDHCPWSSDLPSLSSSTS